MKARRLLVLSVLAIAFGCEGHHAPTAPAVKSVPFNHSAILSDGSNGGNPDFFFLPPLVAPLSSSTPGYEPGQADKRLEAGLTVVICQLKPEIVKGKPEEDEAAKRNDENDKLTEPNAGTACIPGEPRKKFGVGAVELVTDLSTRPDWSIGLDMPADGFYYVLWDTRKVDLKDNKFYRIKVFLDGVTGPLGYMDVASIEDGKKWRNLQTGEVIQIVDDERLPIPFRVEKGALCGGATNCTSTVVTNSGGTVTVKVNGEAVAGARFPNGWLPDGGPQSVIVTISQVNTGESNSETGTQQIPCHAGLPFEQFDACYKFTTTPTLAFIGKSRAQFAIPVTVAVCYVLQGTEDPREKFAEMFASGPNEPAHALVDVSDEGILSVFARNCTPTFGSLNPNPKLNLASIGWRKVKGGLGQLFGVKTAYAVDVGLGGLIDGFSNVGAALPATIQAYPAGATRLIVNSGGFASASAMIVGNHHHFGAGAYTGINKIPVTFTLAPNNGTLGFGEGTALQVTTNTRRISIPNTEGSVDGVASVTWTPPTRPGTYHLTASGPTSNGPVTYRVTVR